jgi:hypothetical protein
LSNEKQINLPKLLNTNFFYTILKNQYLNIVFKFILALLIITASKESSAQVKVSATSSAANPDAMLEIEATNKGLLLPRLSLVSTTSPAPLGNFVKGMLVYDTATINDITPGVYYCDGIKWIKSNAGLTATATNNWSLLGNAGTTAGTNFLGTTDNKDVVFKTNSFERVRITKDGWIGIGTATPQAALQIKGQLIIDTLGTGDVTTDKILVADVNGKVRAVYPTALTSSVQKKVYFVATAGQTNFITPATISDPDKVFLYRNGVLISFAVINVNTIAAEIACAQYDEIKIVQIL